MKFSSCHLIGAGGTGSILAEPLVRLLAYHPNGTRNIYVYDGDKYEDDNSHRQLFNPEFVELNKAEALCRRLAPLCNANPIPKYVEAGEIHTAVMEATLRAIANGQDKDAALIIVAVDSEATRHEIINDLDHIGPGLDFACVLPGNEFRTATCVWYKRVRNKIHPVHPFDVVANYANPTDHARTSCAYKAVSSPQLINANFASALITNEVVYALLEDKALPFRINYSGEELSMTTEGRFL